MDKVMERYEDQHVATTYVYVKTGKAYSDAAQTVAINAADLIRLFLVGMVIVDTGIKYAPVSYEMDGTDCVVTYVKADGTTPTTAVLALVASTEPA